MMFKISLSYPCHILLYPLVKFGFRILLYLYLFTCMCVRARVYTHTHTHTHTSIYLPKRSNV